MSIELKRVVRDNTTEKDEAPVDLGAMLRLVEEIDEYALRGLAEDLNWRECLNEVVAFQLEDGSFPVIVDSSMPGDARIDFVCRPTSACCRVLIRATVLGREVPGMREALTHGLEFCSRWGMRGHGYEDASVQARELLAFGSCGTATFLDEHAQEFPRFARLVGKTLYAYKRDIKSGRVFSAWGKDLTYDLARVVDAFGCAPDQPEDERRWMKAASAVSKDY